MLAVVSHLRDAGLIGSARHRREDHGHDGHVGTGKKIVYVAPMKALAQEVVEKFSSKLKRSGIIVRELTGDMQLSRAEADAAHVLVTTPEKWDVVTRKGGDGSLGSTCGLLIIDEVHLLADERGAVIESIVARLHRWVELSQRQVRLVGLSATLPNYEDVATFLRVDGRRGLFHFGPEHRPVPLRQTFVGVISTNSRDRFQREKRMDDVCYEVVSDALRDGHQVMVFVHSRKGTGASARALAERAAVEGELERLFICNEEGENDARTKYIDRAEKSQNKELREHFRNGMGIHHAGMLRHDRKLSEQMFSDGAIRVLCCTATLAWGINLPAHTVVIKGTDVYMPEKGKNVDLSILDVQQIFGRAGRPQFDTSGDATLITTHDAMTRYLDKLVRATPIESNFIKQLADHMNAEVVGGTVTNIREAIEWIRYTYLHVRMCKNPLAYGISAVQHESDPTLRQRSRELAIEAAKLLDERKMVRYNPESGNLAVCNLGRVASHFYIRNQSIATFNEMLEKRRASPTDADLLHVMCCAEEFENVRVRAEELDEVDRLMKESCPLDNHAPVEEFSGKCNVLLQSYISKARVTSFTLISDTNYIASNAGRVARSLFEMCIKNGNAYAAIKFLRLAKSVDHRFWWFQSPLRAFEHELKNNVFLALEDSRVGCEEGYDTLERAVSLLDMGAKEVGELCRCQRDGALIQKFVRMLPRVDVSCGVHPITKNTLRQVQSWDDCSESCLLHLVIRSHSSPLC
jgi:activating signal cointegrator complex subunit 3